MRVTHPAVVATTFVITRPEQDGETLASWLNQHGAKTLSLPVLAIEPLAPALNATMVAGTQAIIFVSANAVRHGLAWIKSNLNLARLSGIYAIGPATVRALHAAGIMKVQYAESGLDSEALLALPVLQQVDGSSILLVKGESAEGGRQQLAQTLRARGAIVNELVCYTRRPLQTSAASRQTLQQALDSGNPVVFFALSVETLDSLMANLQPVAGWQRALFLVPHARVAQAARDRGVTSVAVIPVPLTSAIEPLEQILQQFYQPS